MKKQLPTRSITNELAGSSVFFPSGENTPARRADAGTASANRVYQHENEPTVHEFKQPHSQATVVASNHATTPPRAHATVMPLTEATNAFDGMETIRQIVRQIGKEAATYRLTREEKRRLGELVYRFGQRGYRTSENEIARISINWLLLDYQKCGQQSVLAQMLDVLHR